MDAPSVKSPRAMETFWQAVRCTAVVCGLALLALFLYRLVWLIGVLLGHWGHIGY
jgi:hypothetical protein